MFEQFLIYVYSGIHDVNFDYFAEEIYKIV